MLTFKEATKGAEKDSWTKHAVDKACEDIHALCVARMNRQEISLSELTAALCQLSEVLDG